MNFSAYRDQIESYLSDVLQSSANGDAEPANDLAAALRYVTLQAGKRLRPCLVYATADLLGVPHGSVHAAAASVELIHCYSLVHDDLPAMDNDDLRRGKPSCHKAFGESTAILAGDALQALAFEVLADPIWNPLGAEQRIAQVKILASAAGGGQGMVLGQAYDMAATGGSDLSLEQLRKIHQHKTGALFNACVSMALQASEQRHDPLLEQQLLNYAQNLGLLFQIQDDILDVIGDQTAIGKPVGSDQAAAKTTYPRLLGLDQAKQNAERVLQNALAALENFGARAQQLENIANFAFSRNG